MERETGFPFMLLIRCFPSTYNFKSQKVDGKKYMTYTGGWMERQTCHKVLAYPAVGAEPVQCPQGRKSGRVTTSGLGPWEGVKLVCQGGRREGRRI